MDKKYDEALERAKKQIEACGDNEGRKRMIYAIFPELVDNKDEDIRKDIIEYLKLAGKGDSDYAQPMINRWIAYLEKNEEPKWSPSEGEMGVLYKLCYISNQITDEDDTELTRLYQDLKREYFNGHSFENMFLNERQKERITEETKQISPSLDIATSIRTSRIETLKNLLSYLKYERKSTQEEINISFIPCLENLLKDAENSNDRAEWSEEDDAAHTRILGAIAKAFMGVLPTKPSEEDVNWLKTLPERFGLQPKQEWSEKDERVREGLLKIFKQSQSGHWGGMEIKDIVAFLERQETNIDRLRKISTKADEDWLEIQKQWEKEDKYKSWMEDYFRQETIDGYDWKTSIVEFKKEGKLSSLWNSMLMGRLGMYVRNWMREQHPEIDQDFPDYADFEDYSWKIFQDLVNEWEVIPTERNVEDVAAEYIEGVKSLHEEPDWNLMHTAVIYGYQLGTEKSKTK